MMKQAVSLKDLFPFGEMIHEFIDTNLCKNVEWCQEDYYVNTGTLDKLVYGEVVPGYIAIYLDYVTYQTSIGSTTADLQIYLSDSNEEEYGISVVRGLDHCSNEHVTQVLKNFAWEWEKHLHGILVKEMEEFGL